MGKKDFGAIRLNGNSDAAFAQGMGRGECSCAFTCEPHDPITTLLTNLVLPLPKMDPASRQPF
jgi:hypothetical protein